MTIQMIPLNQLHPSSANVRKTGASLGIEELAASIAAHGLLQNLQVTPARKDRFEVVAGGRRLAALKLLAKQKKIAKDFAVPCHVLGDEDRGEISLAENAVRLAMHPADQFAAFQSLTESGKGVEEVAARFGVSAAVVRQRLKLASISPRLIEVYREDDMSLDQLMAFTVSDDHMAQEAAWFDQPDYRHDPDDIRAILTAAQVEAGDRRVRLVGRDTYLAAGGGIKRDLFQPEHEGYLTDPALLDRLVAERLAVEVAAVRGEGWKWVEIMARRDYAALHLFGRVYPQPRSLTEQQQEQRDRLAERYDALIEEQGDEPDAAALTTLNALDAQIAAIDDATAFWRAEDLAMAGALIYIGHDGEIEIMRGLVRAEDRAAHRGLSLHTGGKGALEEGVDDPAAKLSSSLIASLTAERTAALRATMQGNETVGLVAVAHALALAVFYGPSEQVVSCLDLRLVSRDPGRYAEGIEDSGAMILLTARQTEWQSRLPEQAGDLFGWLMQQNAATLVSLICFCAALGIDAVRDRQDRADAERLRHADQLAEALGLDMSLWWTPTKESYLGRVPKALILEAVKEGVSAQAAENLSALKKDSLIERAQQKLSGTGWLPPLLRSSKPPVADMAFEAMAAE